jgi:hypothetical protein
MNGRLKRNVFTLAILILLAFCCCYPQSCIVDQHGLVWDIFEPHAGPFDAACFNDSLVTEATTRFTANLSRALSSYSTAHLSYLERPPSSDSLADPLGASVNSRLDQVNLVNAKGRKKLVMVERDWYKDYDGDILADMKSNLAYFPSSFSSTRFQRCLSPNRVRPNSNSTYSSRHRQRSIFY